MSPPFTAVPEELLAAAAQLGASTLSWRRRSPGLRDRPPRRRSRGIRLGIDTAGGQSSRPGPPRFRRSPPRSDLCKSSSSQTLGTSSRHLQLRRGRQRGRTRCQQRCPRGGIIDAIAALLGGPSTSLNGKPFSLSSNAANLLNIGGGNWASAGSDLLGMAGGGLLTRR